MMRPVEDDSVSYSTSCVPPENSNQSDEVDNIPHTIIKFPTLFGTSMGFTRVDDFWDKKILEKRRKIRKLKTNSHLEREINYNNLNSKTPNPHQIRSKSVNRFNKTSYNKIINEFNEELNNKVIHHNLPPSLPRDYNPRTTDRSKSFSKTLMSSANRNNNNNVDLDDDVEDCSDEIYVLDANSNNADLGEEEWINLYFQFPDGHKMRFKTRRKAMMRHSMEAFSARMGYSSIHDLKFIYKGSDIYYNETPSSLNMEVDALIQVQNR